ncbi:non-ribosomal peptide synthetase [Gandjariella thermophila]|uniref:Carrier domain-containing protein n=1 Tax=Gandjariella thermophila TaxID=1931992 RepID=A0A4D4JFN9_9PSEU|nr:non-ribosomal peptide synthetase [Gandjariella thermophila]GDY33810.1 hypothetical protein GTS_54430 [Gandjariella thermophila]
MAQGFSARIHTRAMLSPAETAVVFEDRRLSYRDLHVLADAIHGAVADQELGNAPVGVLLPRSAELVAAPVGILWAGAAYVPLPVDEHPGRIEKLVRECAANVVVTTADRAEEVRRYGAIPVVVEKLQIPGTPTNSVADPPPDALAYVLYTSGSTGDPKGIAMTHRSLRNLVDYQLASTARHLRGEPLRALQFTSLTFDVSFLEIFCTLIAGGTLIVPSDAERQDPVRLHALMARERVTSVFLAHIALQSVAEVGARHAKAGREPLALREVMTGGEQLMVTAPVVDWFTTMPGCTLQNIYGPSETHVITTHDLTGDPATWPMTPPIGRALPNVGLRVLDEGFTSVPAGEPGELCVTGDCLAQGYFGRPDLEVGRFVVDPVTGQRVYRTGDIVKDLGDGVYQYLGRRDDRVKIRGVVVEPTGVEAVLARHPDVEACAVAARPGVGGTRLVAYLVSRSMALPPGSAPVTRHAEPEFQRFLAAELPEPAVPDTYVYLAAMPLGRTDKIDRKALPEPSLTRPELRVPYAPPLTEPQRVVTKLWSELLQIENVGIDDAFFDLGGHSMLLVRLQSRIATELSIEVRVADLLETSTIRELSALLERRWAAATEPVTKTPPEPTGQASPEQKPVAAPSDGRARLKAMAQRRRPRG